MKKLAFYLLALLFVSAKSSGQSAVVQDYINTYAQIAIDEMKRTGVPASITLAQGILETQAGQSNLVRKSNNHFGIKCKNDWKGETVSHDDDAKGECFRKYNDPYESYRDHSDFLKTRKHYAFLFDLDPKDYEGWCYGLKKAGYATNPKYPQLLLKLIREYNLHDYTLIALNDKTPVPSEDVIWAKDEVVRIEAKLPAPAAATYPSGLFKLYGLNVIFAPKGTSFLALATQQNIPLARIYDFNDLDPVEETEADQLVYLQRKRKAGSAAHHMVLKGETLYGISQLHAIQLQSLMEYNGLTRQSVISEGDVLNLMAPKENRRTEVPGATDLWVMHEVKSKETMYALSKKYNVSVEEIVEWNNLPGQELKIGQTLRIKKSNGAR